MIPFHTVTPLYAFGATRPDWLVTQVTDSGVPGYPYLVDGINTNYPHDSHRRRFSWLMPANWQSDPRYDLRNAFYVSRFARAGEALPEHDSEPAGEEDNYDPSFDCWEQEASGLRPLRVSSDC
jgi:hypothetical protein